MYGLPDLVVVQRISNLPIVKSTLDKATDLYDKVKVSLNFKDFFKAQSKMDYIRIDEA